MLAHLKAFTSRPHLRILLTSVVLLAACFLITFLASPVGSISKAASAQAPQVTVRVTIERVRALNCFDNEIPFACAGDPDFYAVVTIDGEEFPKTEEISDESDISPNWEFSRETDYDEQKNIDVKIEILDGDGGIFRGNDDRADLTANGGRDLDITVNLSDCLAGNFDAISGDITANCLQTVVSEGDANDNSAEIFFTIEVTAPPTAPGTNVRCIHDPIWPNATDQVTFTAEALDGKLATKFDKVEIEIWINNRNAPVEPTSSNKTSLTIIDGPYTNPSGFFYYGCLVRDTSSGEEVWTGWRRVQIGQPANGRAVPVLHTGPKTSRVDVVFIADRPDAGVAGSGYNGGATDPAFLGDVHNSIQNAYFAAQASDVDVFLKNQDKFNFWIAQDTGDGNRISPSDPCILNPPSNWKRDYTFADTGALLHPHNYRDCAKLSRRIFSSISPTTTLASRVMLHETGHSPFGLADEYCCDSWYFQPKSRPNLYSDLTECQNDPLTTNVRDSCQPFTDIRGADWFRLDSASTSTNDLMVNNQAPQPADLRRINWFFETCRAGECGRDTVLAAEQLQDQGPREQPFPELEEPDSQVIVVEVEYNESGEAQIVSTEVVTGVAPARFANPPLLEVQLFNNEQQLTEQFNAWNPLLETSESAPGNTGVYIFPFRPELKTMEVVNLQQQGERLVSVDLKPEINQFCDENATNIQCANDLSLSIERDQQQVVAGTQLTYTLTITNSGPVAATSTVVTQTLPPGVIFDAVTSSSSCSNENSSTVVCNVGTVSETTNLSLPVVVTVDPLSPDQTELVSSASLKAKQIDPDSTNNFAEVSTRITREGDLLLAQTRRTDRVLPGQPLVYEITVSNFGSSTVTGVTVEHTFSAGVDFDANRSSAECSVANGTIICDLGTLTDSSSRNITVAGTVTSSVAPGTQITSTSQVYADETDSNSANNLVTDVVLVTGQLFLPLIEHSQAVNSQTEIDLVVKEIVASPSNLEVTIKNVGTAPLLPSDSLWIDVYLAPTLPPSAVNQVWPDLGNSGLVWGIESEALRLPPGEELTLRLGDSYYFSDLSSFPNVIAVGSEIYAQVDSANVDTEYGAVLEGHEKREEPYNNVNSVTVLESISTENWRAAVSDSVDAASTDQEVTSNLPQRP